MTKIPNIADIISGRFNQDKSLNESTADPGAIILEMEHAEQSSGRHNRRLTDLKKLAALRERIIHRMLDSSIDKSDLPKRPHLKIVK